MNAVLHLTFANIAVASGLILFCALASLFLQLRLEKQLLIAAIRTVVQLLLVGYILKSIFALDNPALIGLLILVMIVFAGYAAVGRSKHTYRGVLGHSFATLLISSVITAFIVTKTIIQVHPWYHPQYLIPLLGMILGNSLTGISIALDQLLNDLVERRGEIEMELSHGAGSWEAARGPLSDAIRRGMIPTINAMTVAGIVSLPGMMTGQILAGSDPLEAVKYQIIVMFMLTAATAVGCILMTLLAYRTLFNSRQQLEGRLILKTGK